jgi:hypothetical protein
MKYLILILASLAAIVSLRVQTNDIAKNMYSEGCYDSALKLERIGKPEESKLIYRFCDARKKSLDQYMDAF